MLQHLYIIYLGGKLEMSKKNGWLKYAVIAIYLLLAMICLAISMGVGINYDLSEYLDDESETKIALSALNEEFGPSGNLQIMIEDIDAKDATSVKEDLEHLDNVLNVNFDANDTRYYLDNNALFVVLINGDDYSDNAKETTNEAKELLGEKYQDKVYFGGSAAEKQQLQSQITHEMIYILAIGLGLAIIILLITSTSWLEPLLLLAACGVAIALNRGTNIFFGEISYITNSISTILQLALSVDYSIVLLSAFKSNVRNGVSNPMEMAIRSSLRPVSASALTTIAGLLALVFMSFRIGFDIGMVLMKGILLSFICAMTLLPALVLLFEKAIEKTKKKAFVPKGNAFANIAFKASKFIAPVAVLAILGCFYLQSSNSFYFADPDLGNQKIADTFGQNNTIVLLYPNADDNKKKVDKLISEVSSQKRTDGTEIFSDCISFDSTARETYSIDKAVKKLEISKENAELLYTLYHMKNPYGDGDNKSDTKKYSVGLTNKQFVNFVKYLANNDSDAEGLIPSSTVSSIDKMQKVVSFMSDSYTADEFVAAIAKEPMSQKNVDVFGIKQIYGLYNFSKVSKPNVPFETMLDYLINTVSTDPNTKNMISKKDLDGLKELKQGIKDAAAAYEENQLGMGRRIMDNAGYQDVLKKINSSYKYNQFLTACEQIGNGLIEIEKANPFGGSTRTPIKVTATNAEMQQVYIMYYREKGLLGNSSIKASSFVDYLLKQYSSNKLVRDQLSSKDRDRLEDMVTLYDFMNNGSKREYTGMYSAMQNLDYNLNTESVSVPEKDMLLGVYIKYLVENDMAFTDSIEAMSLLDFVEANMNSNALLKLRMTDEERGKIGDAKAEVNKANELLTSENYSRLLLSVNLPNQSEDTSNFVVFLRDKVKEIFGDKAYIAGETCSTYDLEQAFALDNAMITKFTLISIFIIVMLLFLSLSIPLILVAIIQGAIWISFATNLITASPMFFMSYIITICILMGATIDYGILLSNSYVTYRTVLDKKEALIKALETAMPTVFTSGMILTVCGFVIYFVASQFSISNVGLLLGKGALTSIVMVTCVLPSILYLLDKIIIKLSLKRKPTEVIDEAVEQIEA